MAHEWWYNCRREDCEDCGDIVRKEKKLAKEKEDNRISNLRNDILKCFEDDEFVKTIDKLMKREQLEKKEDIILIDSNIDKDERYTEWAKQLRANNK